MSPSAAYSQHIYFLNENCNVHFYTDDTTFYAVDFKSGVLEIGLILFYSFKHVPKYKKSYESTNALTGNLNDTVQCHN